MQEAGGKRQDAGGRGQEAGCRRQGAKGRMQEAGGKRQDAGGKGQEAGCRRQGAKGRMQEAGGKRQDAGGKGQEAGCRRQGARGRMQEARGKRQDAGGRGQEARGRRQGARGKRQEAIGILLLASCLLYSLFNFFFNLEAESFYYDEVVYSLSGLEYLQGNFARNWEHPFLGKYIIGLSLRLLGKSDFSARLPSALFGFLTGVVIYIFAKEVTNRWCGLAAVCLWSTSPIVLWVSRRAILDAPFVFFFTLSWYLFWRFFQTENTVHGLLGGISLGLAIATKLLGAILVPILFLYLVFPGIRDRGFLRPAVFSKLVLALTVAVLIFLLTYAPVLDRLGSIFRAMSEHWQWEQRVGHREVVNGVIYDKQPWWTYLYWYWRGYPPYLLNYSPGVLVLLGLAMGLALLRGDNIDLYFLLSFLLPFCYLSFYLSYKMFRYADIFEPPLVMSAASFLSAVGSLLEKWKERKAAYWAVVLFLTAILIFAMVHSTWAIQAEKENRYKAVARYLSPRMRGDEIVFVWGYTNVMNWYLGEGYKIVGGFNSNGFNEQYYDADYIVVDPLMVSKWPDDPLKAYLEDNKVTYVEQDVGGFQLYTRKSVQSYTRRFVDKLTNVRIY
jgi:4-amino-4-deoxy-L-arabinose transferase-like glycosyltransferase